MPFTLPPATPLARVWPELLPPSPGHLPPSLDDDCASTDDDDLDMSSSHENPMAYFLSPATPKDDEDLEFEFNFDAGIEDSNKPKGIVRSISPSTLDGLKRYKPKTRAPDCAILDDDEDDGEDYIRFRPRKSLPIAFDDYFNHPGHASPSHTSQTTEALLSPTFHVGSPRGRQVKRFAPSRRSLKSRGRPRSLSLQRRHSWREPSPDVWSIEEEPEKETMSELGMSVENLDLGKEKKTQPIDIPAAKPKKKVRFVLPDEE
ncbi:hypothetical protein GGR56DRAFT_108923 [Xylariaceae sp. FL0804]|nr:hypothetical protein GGR56DRAFT_108923 [Xylariaceae sp. FL0804]